MSKFCLFAFPCYWTLAVMCIALAVWKTGFSDPDFISAAWLSIAIIAAAVLLMKKDYWVSLPMIALGISIALQQDQHAERIFRIYGAYLIFHYFVCGIIVWKARKKERV